MDEPIPPCGSYAEFYRQLNQQRAVNGLPAIPDPAEREKEMQERLALDLITYNEYRVFRGRKLIVGGDIPMSAYIAQYQQADAPLIVGG